ncbi:MAG: hypothetical protein KBS74_02255 [Clostridiales bacterium]|nr:hypothetical protein [Candidatus Cacconaster stercorequi]
MTGKRMRKLLMAAGVQRNVANKISHAGGKNISHEDMLLCVLLVPGLRDAIKKSARQRKYRCRAKEQVENEFRGWIW